MIVKLGEPLNCFHLIIINEVAYILMTEFRDKWVLKWIGISEVRDIGTNSFQH